ncbi:MAG: hypothetical protein MHMPM18_004719 [Marteilia pararefringens]
MKIIPDGVKAVHKKASDQLKKIKEKIEEKIDSFPHIPASMNRIDSVSGALQPLEKLRTYYVRFCVALGAVKLLLNAHNMDYQKVLNAFNDLSKYNEVKPLKKYDIVQNNS